MFMSNFIKPLFQSSRSPLHSCWEVRVQTTFVLIQARVTEQLAPILVWLQRLLLRMFFVDLLDAGLFIQKSLLSFSNHLLFFPLAQ